MPVRAVLLELSLLSMIWRLCPHPPVLIVKLCRLFCSIYRQKDSVACCPPIRPTWALPRSRSLPAPTAARLFRERVSPTEADREISDSSAFDKIPSPVGGGEPQRNGKIILHTYRCMILPFRWGRRAFRQTRWCPEFQGLPRWATSLLVFPNQLCNSRRRERQCRCRACRGCNKQRCPPAKPVFTYDDNHACSTFHGKSRCASRQCCAPMVEVVSSLLRRSKLL